MAKIINCMGGHEVNIIQGAVYNDSIRKYVGGQQVLSIPFSGTMLSANIVEEQTAAIDVDGINIPTVTKRCISVDQIPNTEDYFIVSVMYVNACKELKLDTSHLLTVGNSVVDEKGKVIGVIGLCRN